MTIGQERLTPTQEDREDWDAAIALWNELSDAPNEWSQLSGAEQHTLVQAFARHRLAALKSPPIAGGEGAVEQPAFGTKDDAGNSECLAKAMPDEPMFIILARDPDGARTVRLWAERRYAADPKEYGHAAGALAIANAMDRWREGPTAIKPRSAPAPEAYAKPTTSGDVGKLCERLNRGVTRYCPSPTYDPKGTAPDTDAANALMKEAAARISALEKALEDIAQMTDPDDEDSYRADDREGCLDTVHATARALLNPTPTE